MPEINPINVRTQNITNANAQEAKAEKEEKKEEKNLAPQVERTPVDEKEVFNYMANNGVANMANVKMSPAALVSKYNSPEAVARISALMGEFEAGVVAGLAKFEEELGAAPAYKNLSESDKMALGAQYYTSNTEW